MKTKIVACIVVVLSLCFSRVQGQVITNPLVDKTIFSDQFTGTQMNALKWYIPTWVSPTDGTFVGRTQFRVSQNSPLPRIKNGLAYVALGTYNPTGFSLYGTDLISKRTFKTNSKGILFTCVAKIQGPILKGLVAGIFLYALKPGSNTLHDEIDFEILGNYPWHVQTNIYGNEPLEVGHPVSYKMKSSATSYHTYQILWSTNQVSWYVDTQLVRTVTTESPIPVGPMCIHLNMWAPGQEWPNAYDASLQPVSNPSLNKNYFLLVDQVMVQTVF